MFRGMKAHMPSDPQDEHLDTQVAVLVISLTFASLVLPIAISDLASGEYGDLGGIAVPVAMSLLFGARAAWQLCKTYAQRKRQAGSGPPS